MEETKLAAEEIQHLRTLRGTPNVADVTEKGEVGGFGRDLVEIILLWSLEVEIPENLQ